MKNYDRVYAGVYAALWAYGAETLGLNGTELVYRTVSRLASEAATKGFRNSPLTIVDLGCGVGRTVRDLALAFPLAQVHGLDTSAAMVDIARSVVKGGETVVVDLDARGFPEVSLRTVDLSNAEFHVIEDMGGYQLETLQGMCDVVVSLNTIERVSDIQGYICNIVSLLTGGGALVLASSLNWQTEKSWQRFPTFSILQDHVAMMGDLRVVERNVSTP